MTTGEDSAVSGDNFLKRKLLNGEHALGCFLLTGSSDNAEVLAHAGFDFLLRDHEHASGSRSAAIPQSRPIKGPSTTSRSRTPSLDPGNPTRVIDTGVQ